MLRRLRNENDSEAWFEFDRRYGELIIRFCRRRGLQLSDAEDVRQIVLLSLAGALPKFRYDRQAGRFRGYLGRTVRNAIFRYSSRPNRSLESLVLGEAETIQDPAEAEVDKLWEEEWIRHHMRLALESIHGNHDRKSMEIFDRLLAGARPNEVAAETGMSVAAVHKIKQRVRDRLREQIARQIAEEDAFE